MSDPFWVAQLYVPVTRRKTIHLMGLSDSSEVHHFHRVDDLLKSAHSRGISALKVDTDQGSFALTIKSFEASE